MSWGATAYNQLLSGSLMRDGGTASGPYSVTTTIPSSLDNKIMSKADFATYTNFDVSVGNWTNYANSKLIDKSDVESVL